MPSDEAKVPAWMLRLVLGVLIVIGGWYAKMIHDSVVNLQVAVGRLEVLVDILLAEPVGPHPEDADAD